MSTVLLTKHDPKRGIGQLLTVLHKAKGQTFHALRLAEEAPYHRNPAVADAIKTLIEIQTKGAVGAGTTAQSGWASELAPNSINREAYMLWEGRSIVGRVLQSARRVPWHATTAKETGAGVVGAWRGESLPAINGKSAFDTLRIDYREATILATVSAELLRFGAMAELAVTRLVTEAVTTFSDTQFLDPAITATSARPASVTNGAMFVTSTGSSAAQITADLASMVQLLQMFSDGDAWTWIMRPVTYYTIAARLAGAGTPITPGFLLGIPVLLGAKSPPQIVLLDVSNVAYASDDTITVDISTEANVEMDSAPGQSGVAGTGASTVSLYQTSLAGILALLPVSWQTIRYSNSSPTVSAGCVYMTVAY